MFCKSANHPSNLPTHRFPENVLAADRYRAYVSSAPTLSVGETESQTSHGKGRSKGKKYIGICFEYFMIY